MNKDEAIPWDRRTLLGRIMSLFGAGLVGASLSPDSAKAVERSDLFVGTIQHTPYSFAPRGWAFCEGQLLATSQYSALFSLVGTTYGGDGRTSFALPDLRRLEKQMKRQNDAPTFRHIISLSGVYPSRN